MNRRIIVDAHEDIAFNALALGRDYRSSALEKRSIEGPNPGGGLATIGLPDALRGNVRVIFSTLYASPESPDNKTPGLSYTTPQEAEAQARDQVAYYEKLTQDPRIKIIRTRTDLDHVISYPEPCVGFVLLMEGADPIVQPENAVDWYEAGVRIVGPAWHRTRYAGGTSAPGPLTDLGRELVRELARLGIILDTSHLSDASFFEALDLFEGTIIASHSNARTFVPTDRQLSDEMMRALIARDSVIGTVFCNDFLKHGWSESGSNKADVTLQTLVDEIKYVCDLAGDAQHVGIGTDFDGGFGAESIPFEMDTVADLSRVGEALSVARFDDSAVDDIMGGNWLRILRRALPAR